MKASAKSLTEIRTLVVDTEPYKASRASLGTLAVAASDAGVAAACVTEKCHETLTAVLGSQMPELVHRALVVVKSLCEAESLGVAQSLVDGGVVPAVAMITRLGDPFLKVGAVPLYASFLLHDSQTIIYILCPVIFS